MTPEHREAPPAHPSVSFYEERARWYRDGCDGLEDVEDYRVNDLAQDAAADMLALCSRVRDLEAALRASSPAAHAERPDPWVLIERLASFDMTVYIDIEDEIREARELLQARAALSERGDR